MQVMQKGPEEHTSCCCSDPVHTERSCGYDTKAGEEGRTVRDDITEEPCTRVQSSKQSLRRNQAN